jgi:hypothetical protein
MSITSPTMALVVSPCANARAANRRQMDAAKTGREKVTCFTMLILRN